MVTSRLQNCTGGSTPRLGSRQRGQAGALTTELVIAMAILVAVLLPMAYAFDQGLKLSRRCYNDAVAMEIVDGEMEVLAAGEWRAFAPGVQPYTVRADAVTNLPPGRFVLTVRDQSIRLQWRPEVKGKGRPIVREAKIK